MLLLVEIGLTLLFGFSYTTIFHSEELLDFDDIYQDVVELGAETAFQVNDLPEDIHIEILDDKNTIVDGYRSDKPNGYRYSQKEINMFLNNLYLDVYAFYPKDDSKKFVLFFVPNRNGPISMDTIVFSVAFFLALVALTVHVISQRLGQKFLDPLNELMVGLKKIKKGDYQSKIKFNSESEFDQVRDAINALSSDLDKEITRRKAVEDSRNQLVVDISHDLKTPLTSVIGYSEVMLRNLRMMAEMDDQQRDMLRYLEIISKNGKQANRLLQNLSDFSQLQAPDLRLHRQAVDLPEALRTFLGGCIPEIEEAGFDFAFFIPENPIICQIDEFKIQRTIQNLIDNALKYNPAGTTLVVRLTDLDQWVRLEVKDDGVGIPASYQATIFEPFIRADQDRNRETGGSGLGLAITKKIIEKHGGTIRLLSDESGSRFIIRLPKEPPAQNES
jgi:signal transduction histidine kinase